MLINSLSLENFKCFEKLDVKFAPITLLTGANSSGKSSLINAILAVLQTEGFPIFLSPNGRYVTLGSFDELMKANSKKKEFHIGITIQREYGPNENLYNVGTSWKLNKWDTLPILALLNYQDDKLIINFTEDDDFYIVDIKLDLSKRDVSGFFYKEVVTEKQINDIDGIFDKCKYIKEDNYIKISNIKFIKDFHPADVLFKIEEVLGGYIFTGDVFFELQANDKFAFNYIGSFRNPPNRTYYRQSKPDFKLSTSGEGYIDQLIEWEEIGSVEYYKLIKSAKDLGLFNSFKAVKFKSSRFDINIKTHKKSRHSSLADVGFGVSQFLPILVADLQLSNNSCFAISQPEIHLHPNIQAKFGNYIVSQIKETKKQYIVETHSEYLINRIRLLLVTGELKPEDVKVYYFENDGSNSVVHDIEFTTKGTVNGAPDGFFETYGIDVMDIAINAVG